jgi:hypothetical protein
VKRALTLQLVVVVLVVPLGRDSAAGTFRLNAAILWSGSAAPCGPGYPSTAECDSRVGRSTAVPGLGFVSETYVYPIDTSAGTCPSGLVKIPSYPAKLTVKDRGEISFDVSGAGCVEGFSTATISPTQAFTITGGSGVFAGASGAGVVERTQTQFVTGTSRSSGLDTWAGTLVAPGFEPDLTPPTITGATNRVVRAPPKARSVRVRFQPAASDNVDGVVSVSCVPASGSRFKAGTRTVVHCAATDSSANTATASFSVTVRRASKH